MLASGDLCRISADGIGLCPMAKHLMHCGLGLERKVESVLIGTRVVDLAFDLV